MSLRDSLWPPAGGWRPPDAPAQRCRGAQGLRRESGSGARPSGQICFGLCGALQAGAGAKKRQQRRAPRVRCRESGPSDGG
eukprot:scaffold1498_cov314-Prasinococcus_capsulatus_cf.AAC.1